MVSSMLLVEHLDAIGAGESFFRALYVMGLMEKKRPCEVPSRVGKERVGIVRVSCDGSGSSRLKWMRSRTAFPGLIAITFVQG